MQVSVWLIVVLSMLAAVGLATLICAAIVLPGWWRDIKAEEHAAMQAEIARHITGDEPHPYR